MKIRLPAFVLLTILALGVPATPALEVPGLSSSKDTSALLPRPAGIEPNVQFWIRIYSEVGSEAGLIHDSRRLDVVYERIAVPQNASRRSRDRITRRARDKYKAILLTLGKGKRKNLSADEARVLALFGEGVSNADLQKAARQVRFQRGLADRFRAGIIRSGRWRAYIEKIFQDQGLPVELAALPHVESSYNPEAYSHVGAAGLWQFMRGTGRRFMRVDHVVDERLDPYRATVAAARLLEANYQVTGSWPLAITAYNHGASGMRRAKRKLGTDDIATIVHKYRSRTFGFASRNFYSEFLAALEVDQNAEHYFGPLVPEAPIEYEEVSLPYYTTASALERALGISRSVLQGANPALRPMVWSGEKRVPKNYRVRVPRERLAEPMGQLVAAIPDGERYAAQTRDRSVRVRRGDTLSGIAARYGTSVHRLMAINNLRSRHRIRVGQVLNLPSEGRGRRGPAPVESADPPSDGIYIVQSGDTIGAIAKRFGVTEHEIVRRNRLRSKHRISVGQEIRVGEATASAALAAPAESPSDSQPAQPAEAAAADRVPSSSTLVLANTAAETAAEAPHADTDSPDPNEVEELEDIDLDEAPELTLPGTTGNDPAAIAARTSETTEVAAAEAPAALPLTLPATQDEAALTREALLADPSDYSVAPDGSVEVQATETLGHIAEWLDVRASQLRRLNGLRYGQPIRVGRRLRLTFDNVNQNAFLQRRLEHHRAIQAAFFEQFEIAGTTSHTIRRGDSIWVLSRDTQVPLWLMRQYNPDLDPDTLDPGTKLTLPKLQPHGLTAETS